MQQKIIAISGSHRYLLSSEPENGMDMAQVLDLAQKKLFPPFSLDATLARGYWEPYKGEQSKFDELLAQIEETKGH